MKQGILLLILVTLHTALSAGDYNRKSKVYRARVTLLSEPAFIKGFLSEVSDSSVSITLINPGFQEMNSRNSNPEFHFSVIDEIRISRKNSALRGMGYGALGGLLIASIVYNAKKEEVPASSDPFEGIGTSIEGGVWGSIGMLAGGAAGAVAGMSIKVKIPVKGSQEQFSSNQNRLGKYVLRP